MYRVRELMHPLYIRYSTFETVRLVNVQNPFLLCKSKIVSSAREGSLGGGIEGRRRKGLRRRRSALIKLRSTSFPDQSRASRTFPERRQNSIGEMKLRLSCGRRTEGPPRRSALVFICGDLVTVTRFCQNESTPGLIRP